MTTVSSTPPALSLTREQVLRALRLVEREGRRLPRARCMSCCIGAGAIRPAP
ncbi:hypothetical protein [Hymenobacter sp. BRD67]|uniref:hypothetical protein n=1 Tax=Hymenobacter sp. BRD67 TaxID=2675877 RepID=UPI0015661CFC|nr:hypothetical protein [Hymenobacter sp. BRD67]QKG54007.1 hypothetical protein GKZ67_17095 [Hymenobacter sp. BRD67]